MNCHLINEVCLVGRTGGPPELRTFPSGKRVAKVRLAVDNPRDKDSPFWFNIEFWGKLSEVVDRHLSKGRQISLCGDLRYESWVDKDSGKDCYKYVIVAREFRFLGGGGAAQVQSDSIF